MDKKVSIITPCFNGEGFIERYLNSILNQTYKNIELILINDGSNDKTEKIIKKYICKFNECGIEVIYIYQENSGQAAALNKGLKIFSGEYLTWPDSDDILAKDSIEKKVRFLEENKDYGFVRTDAAFVEENNMENIRGYLAKNKLNKYIEEIFLDLIIETMYVCCGCYMVRTKAFIDVNPNKNIYEGPGGQNWQMLLPIAYKYKCGYIDEPLYTYVIRKKSHSHNIKGLQDEFKRYDEHQEILINTLQNINMSENERKKYIEIVNEKYTRKKFLTAAEYGNRSLIRKLYKNIKKEYKVSRYECLQYISSKNNTLKKIINQYRNIRQNFNNLWE